MGIQSVLILLSLHFFAPTANKKEYVIYHGSNNIGTITAVEQRAKDSTHYQVTSHVSYHSLLYNMDRYSLTTVSYFKALLTGSKAVIEKNGKRDQDLITVYKDGKYHNQGNDDAPPSIAKKITWCSSKLYFQEPTHTDLVFAEAYQELCPIVPMEKAHSYELTLPGNKKNEYHYKDGKLILVKVNRTLFSITFRPKS